MKTWIPKNTTLVLRLLCSGIGFGSIPSVGHLKFVPTGIWGDDGVDLVIGTRSQVELLSAIVDQDFWFEDFKVPQYMALQLYMLHIPVHCHLYGTVIIFFGEGKAEWTHIHKSFLFPQSPLGGLLDCWYHYCIYLIFRGNPKMFSLLKLNDRIYLYSRVLGNIRAYQA